MFCIGVCTRKMSKYSPFPPPPRKKKRNVSYFDPDRITAQFQMRYRLIITELAVSSMRIAPRAASNTIHVTYKRTSRMRLLLHPHHDNTHLLQQRRCLERTRARGRERESGEGTKRERERERERRGGGGVGGTGEKRLRSCPSSKLSRWRGC